MKKAIIDTNMLLVPGQHKVDIFTQLDSVIDDSYQIIILESTIKELNDIIQGKNGSTGEDKQAAKLALMLIEHQKQRDFAASTNCKGLKVISSSVKHTDDAIITIAEDDTLVATNDSKLRQRLLEKGVQVIYLKQKQYLTLT